GVKFFGEGGWKLADEDERALEDLLGTLDEPPEATFEEPADDGSYGSRYEELVAERFGSPLAGLRIACDCANGAMSGVAPSVLERLGATVTAVGDAPDGRNINVGCGATDLALLERVVSGGDFDLGVAFDGDGDRMLAVDGEGRALDGDEIIAVLALHLGVDLVVVTSMSNLGLHRLMARHGIRVVTTDVGDRYVLEALRRTGGVLGGEQSGHLIYLRGHCTGDGLVAALLLARALVETGTPLAELAAALPRFPQVQANVRVGEKRIPDPVRREVERLNESLGERGRVLVRPSGTEPVLRILAEAESAWEAESLCGKVTALVQKELG
ncbi:MAG: phosphoglucosamine mutase, partial [Thermoleophilia bacterium]|nr:phosphoglucosamine mutase [Thermoleophilia bacterium]